MRETPPPTSPAPSFTVPSTAISGGCLAMAAPIVIFFGSILGSAVLALRFHSAAPWIIAGLGLVGAIAFVLSPARLTVERDGLRFAWMGKKRWIPFTELSRAAVYDRMSDQRTRDTSDDSYTVRRVRQVGMKLHLRSAEAVDIPMMRNDDRGRARADELVASIEQARLAAGGAPAGDA
jgi:hypothetical protein